MNKRKKSIILIILIISLIGIALYVFGKNNNVTYNKKTKTEYTNKSNSNTYNNHKKNNT